MSLGPSVCQNGRGAEKVGEFSVWGDESLKNE